MGGIVNWLLGLGEQYGVDPLVYAMIYVGALPFMLLWLAWLVRRLRRGQPIILPLASAIFFFLAPTLYIVPFTVVATDGVPLPVSAQHEKDTIVVAPGERYDVIWTAREPGQWLLHCHINHHTTNDNVEMERSGGLMLIFDVAP